VVGPITDLFRNVRQASDRLRGRVPARIPAPMLPTVAPRPYPMLFIVGSPRSGTTWVSSIFGHHPNTISTHESKFVDQILERLKGCDPRRPAPWKGILDMFDDLQRSQSVVGLHRYVQRSVFEQILDLQLEQARRRDDGDAARATWETVRQVLDAFYLANGGRGRQLLVEKTPQHVLWGEQILREFPHARLLHVLRDGRDVCVSLESRARGAGWDLTERTRQIRLWKKCAQHGRRIVEAPEFAGRTAEIRYEQIKADPTASIARLFAFADLPCSPRRAARVARLTDFRRHRTTGEGQHNRKGVVGDWRQRFSAEDRELFRELAGDVFLHCGYRFDGPTAKRPSAPRRSA
jgi:hypothetical protein